MSDSETKPEGLPLLEGERIRLRAFRDDDLHDLFAVHSDPEVMRYWSFPVWTELEQARPRLESAMTGSDPTRLLCWAMTKRDDDRLIGGVTMYDINPEQGRAEIGYSLGSAHWGQGLAKEALQLVLGHAFGALHLRRVEADIDPRNEASVRLIERLGFVREGVLRERWLVAGDLQDSALYGLLAREWNTVSKDP